MTRNTHPVLRFRARSTGTPDRRRAAIRPRPRVVAQPCPRSVPEREQAAMALDVEWDGPRPVVVVSGELDLVGGDLLAAVLDHVRSSRAELVAVDLSGVTFVDTHGLAPAMQPDVVLVDPSRVVCRLLSLMGLPDPADGPDGRPRRRRAG
ncbi:STAS domain-containing protein [Blastococcus saxobsidens]|uniref:STAS domain-containing protein n=1 Tax=Blastococcus saxobsidens TaxID=138336 RepID=A0A6L9VZ99_9ACTN|nr:STAS domain-containing protein [Blastococcus saxobsidens]NEK84520.1 STAS domain-containing protein [Blastococcus saxobsidens]